MFYDDDPSREPPDLSGLTNIDFLIGFVLPVALLGAAFAILKNPDGRLTRSGYLEGCGTVLLGTLAAFFLTGIAYFIILKGIFGVELPITNEMWWSTWVGLGALFAAYSEKSKARNLWKITRKSGDK